MRLINAYTGLSGEVGEITEPIKKKFWHKDELPTDADVQALSNEDMKKELGDALYYLAMTAYELGFTLEEVAQTNIDKLAERYNGK
jgi:NTP pyrophosphatase (non-canonical NTP hydrolase)